MSFDPANKLGAGPVRTNRLQPNAEGDGKPLKGTSEQEWGSRLQGQEKTGESEQAKENDALSSALNLLDRAMIEDARAEVLDSLDSFFYDETPSYKTDGEEARPRQFILTDESTMPLGLKKMVGEGELDVADSVHQRRATQLFTERQEKGAQGGSLHPEKDATGIASLSNNSSGSPAAHLLGSDVPMEYGVLDGDLEYVMERLIEITLQTDPTGIATLIGGAVESEAAGKKMDNSTVQLLKLTHMLGVMIETLPIRVEEDAPGSLYKDNQGNTWAQPDWSTGKPPDLTSSEQTNSKRALGLTDLLLYGIKQTASAETLDTMNWALSKLSVVGLGATLLTGGVAGPPIATGISVAKGIIGGVVGYDSAQDTLAGSPGKNRLEEMVNYATNQIMETLDNIETTGQSPKPGSIDDLYLQLLDSLSIDPTKLKDKGQLHAAVMTAFKSS